ncbi:hypothetical protein KIW84_055688 [Lathyrus oleraceus]|uniref:Uncharacterized protein n=1 Tax=Pisum sativum TaxID=3888 RepID=A0A9D4WYM4_PEA|nr:hypothetical protein KIW84_055688 [Pisum sativum]
MSSNALNDGWKKDLSPTILETTSNLSCHGSMLGENSHGMALQLGVVACQGATPFSLVYGMEAVLPVEVEIPSLRMVMDAKVTEAEWCQTRFDQLNMIKEKRLIAMCHGQLYKQRMKKAFAKKVRPRVFREGDVVLKKILTFKPDSRGKWTPNYECPYVVKRAFSGGALILTTIYGEEFTRLVNADVVKKYFA